MSVEVEIECELIALGVKNGILGRFGMEAFRILPCHFPNPFSISSKIAGGSHLNGLTCGIAISADLGS